MRFYLSEEAAYAIQQLEANGYEAFAVGGCVRDGLMGISPKDWDIATNALPQQIIQCFQQNRVIETGLKHGTVTVSIHHAPIEITTYRIDGEYSDGRRPDDVLFVNSIIKDLSRRDFTMNAIAYHPVNGLIDPFGGESDIKDKTIRCVGKAENRFMEDALRIIRALRFSSTLNFIIEDETAKALHPCRSLLKNISVERLATEFNKMLMGENIADILLGYSDVIGVFIPEILDMIGLDQRNPHHHLDVWQHTVEAIKNSPQDFITRLVMFFHDIGKPSKFFIDAKGIGHFYNHPQKSAEIAERVLLRLKYDKYTLSQVKLLVRYHDQTIPPNESKVKKWLNILGDTLFAKLLDIKRADASAQSPNYRSASMSHIDKLDKIYQTITRENQCYQIKDLALSGADLIDVGIPEGPLIGEILEQLLTDVIDGRIFNEKYALLESAIRICKYKK